MRSSEPGTKIARWMTLLSRMNTVEHVRLEGKDFVLKRRTWYSRLIVFICNLITRRRRVPVVILKADEFYAWEMRLSQLLDGEAISAGSRGGILLPRIPGRSAAEILSDSACPMQEKLDMLRQAALSLRELHETYIDDTGTTLSHGDATVFNVIYNKETGSAQWFDFEQRHEFSVEQDIRHADDLRAMIFSAAARLERSTWPSMIHAIIDEYAYEPVLKALRTLAADSCLEIDLYHLAQSMVGLNMQRAVKLVLITELDRRFERMQ